MSVVWNPPPAPKRLCLHLTCLHPIQIVNRKYTSTEFETSPAYKLKKFFALRKKDYQLIVPCGKCILCRKKRANDWRFRLLAEYGDNSAKVVFFTLTFANDSDIEDYQKNSRDYIRRWRQNFKYHMKYSPRYFIIEDIGGRYGRLHLHGLLFDYSGSTTLLRKHHMFWKYGFSDVQWSNSIRSVSYLCGYLTTSNLKKDATKHGYPLCEKALKYIPRVFVSNGLGKKFLTPQIVDYFRNKLYNHYIIPQNSGYILSLPRYYRDKIWTKEEIEFLTANQKYWDEISILSMLKWQAKGNYLPYFFQQRYLSEDDVRRLTNEFIQQYEDTTNSTIISYFGDVINIKKPEYNPFLDFNFTGFEIQQQLF